jgi:hypothetical protein
LQTSQVQENRIAVTELRLPPLRGQFDEGSHTHEISRAQAGVPEGGHGLEPPSAVLARRSTYQVLNLLERLYGALVVFTI